MTIKNPVLRFLAGLAVCALAVTVLVFFFAVLGSLVEPVYAWLYPWLYAHAGYKFWTAVLMGLWVTAVILAGGASLYLIFFRAILSVGNYFFGYLPEEDGDKEADSG